MTTTKTTTLQDARARIDEINEQVVELLAERQAIVDELCDIKADADRAVRDPEREAELLAHVRSVATEAGFPPDLAETLFEEILAHSVRHQRRRRNGERSSDAAGEASSDAGSAAAAADPADRNGAAS
ncbi:MAG: chorismate mutase [Salinibacter sp.]